MPRLEWDKTSEHIYETGTDHGVLYVQEANGTYGKGVAWNGLTAVNETPSGAEANPIYADNIKYLDIRSAEEFGATIEAYTYPDEFMLCDGSATPAKGVVVGQQPRRAFGFSYRSIVGNDTLLNDFGYKLHLIYGATANPSEKAYQTVNDSPEAISFSWEMTTVPIAVNLTDPTTNKQFKPTAQLTIDSTKVDATKLKSLEDILYGDGTNDARLPLPEEVLRLFGVTG